MPTALINLDDASPQITYVGTWSQNHTADTETYLYYRETFYSTTTPNDYMEYRFNGSSITIFGSKNYNHGPYSTTLDSGNPLAATSVSEGRYFQQSLFQQGGLDTAKEHVVQLKHTGTEGQWLDIDMIQVGVEVGGSTDEIIHTIIDDSSGIMLFDPVDTGTDPEGSLSWQTKSGSVSSTEVYNATFHATLQADYSVTIPFNGSSIQVFGGLSANHGGYNVSLDGMAPVTYTGKIDSAVGYLYQQQIFGASSLSDGAHTVKFTNLAGATWWDIDYAVVNGTKNASSSASAAPAASSGGSSANDSIGKAVGGAIGALILLAFLIFFLIRRRRHRQQQDRVGFAIDTDEDVSSGGGSHDQGMGESYHPTPFVPFSGAAATLARPTGGRAKSSNLSGGGSPEEEGVGMVELRSRDRSDLISLDADPAQRYQLSSSDYTNASSIPTNSSLTVLQSSPPHSAADPTSPSSASTSPPLATARRTKTGQLAATPPTAVAEQPRGSVREQDAGPVRWLEGEEEEKIMPKLPPAYEDATASGRITAESDRA